jgi:hypothetical protein
MNVMKTVLCAVIFCILLWSGCGKNLRSPEEHWRSGWVDAHSFRVRAVGTIPGSARGGGNARHAAVEMAKKIVTENFTAARCSVVPMEAHEYRSIRADVIREFSNVINNGIVVSEQRSSGTIYTITYEVRGDRLREKVLRAIPRQ